MLEWFDFAAYGFFAAVIGRQFFPGASESASLLAAFGVFASGFLARPVGAAFFGHLGDRKGREVVLRWSVILMGLSTFCLGALPNYATIGVAAPILLTVLRLVQGFSVGGEFTGSIIYLVEHASPRRRGFIGVWAFLGAFGGMLLGSTTGAVINSLLTPEQVDQWGWRIPFLGGVVIMAAAAFFRRQLKPRNAPKPCQASPLIMAVKTEWRTMLQIMGMFLLGSSGFYMLFIYMTTYLHTEFGMAEGRALEINSISMLALILFSLGMAWLSDRIGRKPVLLFSSIGCLLFAYPLFVLVQMKQPLYTQLAQLCFAFFLSGSIGACTAVMVETTRQTYRCSAISLAYNITLAIFGGTTPMVATWLISESGNALEPAFYLMALSAITAVSVFFLPETFRIELDRETR
nr:MFS transporter [Cerasicoccus sp. TK19100]